MAIRPIRITTFGNVAIALSLPLLFAVSVFTNPSLGRSDHFPPVRHPADNVPTEARVELGRKLFFDPVLSLDSTISCGSCHLPKLAFSDSVSVSPGVEGRLAIRNAPPLFNVGYRDAFLRDGTVPTLEMQALVPIQEHAEMAFNLVDAALRLEQDKTYRHLSRLAYDREPDPFVITRALGVYQRSLVSQDSEWDRYVEGTAKLSPKSKKGLKAFEKAGCARCHDGDHFSNFETHNIGLASYALDSGLARLTTLKEDVGMFLTPTLRNLAFTAPYMHDGSMATLMEVVEHYDKGGNPHRNLDPRIGKLELNRRQKEHLLHFLTETLRDDSFVERHRSDPTRPLPGNLLPQP